MEGSGLTRKRFIHQSIRLLLPIFKLKAAMRSVSGQFRILLSAFAPLPDSFRSSLTDYAGCAMK
jgi:hypothetical protein